MLALFRAIALFAYFLIAALLGLVICLFRPFNPDNTLICGKLFSWGALHILGIHYTKQLISKTEYSAPGIVVANHQSNYDLFVCAPALPRRTVVIGKNALKYLPFFGQVFWLAGNILIDRSNLRQSISIINKVAQAIRYQNTSVWVFPEGTRNHGKQMLPFKKGAFHMAIQAQSPIYPLVTSTYAGKLNFNAWRSGSVTLKQLQPIETKGMTEDDIPRLMDLVFKEMLKNIHQLDQEIAEKTTAQPQ